MPARSFRRAGSPPPSSLRKAATSRSTSLVSTPASPYRFGAPRAGFTPTIRAAGSNGIAAIIGGAGWRTRTAGRSSAGRRCAGTSSRSNGIASGETSSAAPDNGRRFCIGPMTAARFEPPETLNSGRLLPETFELFEFFGVERLVVPRRYLQQQQHTGDRDDGADDEELRPPEGFDDEPGRGIGQ